MWLKVKSLNHKTQNTVFFNTCMSRHGQGTGVRLQCFASIFFLALGICYVVMLVSFCGELRANEGMRRELHESVTI